MRYVFSALLIFMLAGCVRGPIEPRNDPSFPPQITFANASLANMTAVSPPIMERRNGGILYVTVPIRSASNYDFHIDYRVTFLNQAGAPIYQSGWTGGTTLVRNVPSEIQFNSPNADAADFRLDIRYAE
jgi:hypothetical protein